MLGTTVCVGEYKGTCTPAPPLHPCTCLPRSRQLHLSLALSRAACAVVAVAIPK